MFPAVKQNPGCQRFKRGSEVETVVTWWLITQDTETFSVFVPFLRTCCLQDSPILLHQTPLCEARWTASLYIGTKVIPTQCRAWKPEYRMKLLTQILHHDKKCQQVWWIKIMHAFKKKVDIFNIYYTFIRVIWLQSFEKLINIYCWYKDCATSEPYSITTGQRT